MNKLPEKLQAKTTSIIFKRVSISKKQLFLKHKLLIHRIFTKRGNFEVFLKYEWKSAFPQKITQNNAQPSSPFYLIYTIFSNFINGCPSLLHALYYFKVKFSQKS